MKEWRIANNQQELDSILAAGDHAKVLTGYFQVRSGYVEARESSHVVAWESSHVVARESSHVEASGSSHVVARESSHVEASKYVSCVVGQNHSGQITGGIQINPDYSTPLKWLDYHGIKITKNKVILFKAVRNDYHSSHNFLYALNSNVAAPDWDNGEKECGGGLHVSPCPLTAKSFDSEATKFLAIEVNIKDIAIGPMPLQYPYKCKIKQGKVLYEVDQYGNKL